MGDHPGFNDELLKQNTQKLISALMMSIKESKANPAIYYEDSWQNPDVWYEVIEYLSEIIVFSNPPGVYLGFAKYFDFYSLECFSTSRQLEVQRLVSKIVEIASNLIQKPGTFNATMCGAHEDHACVFHPWRRGLGFKDINYVGWPLIPAANAVNFFRAPHKSKLTKGKLIRIVGRSNNPYGSWWILDADDPATKKKWRSDMAVLSKWNKGDGYVEIALKPGESLNIWLGAAASQFVPNEKCILTGGGNQVWVDQKEIRRFILVPKKKTW